MEAHYKTGKQSGHRRLAAALALSMLVLAALFSGQISIVLSKGRLLADRQIGRPLKRRGVAAYFSFDDPRLAEPVGRGTSITASTRLVAARYGKGRQMKAHDQAYVQTAVPLSLLSASFSVSCWLRIPGDAPANQSFFPYLALKDGALQLQLPHAVTLTAQVPVRDAFFHIVGIVDGVASNAHLYINGVLQATLPIIPFHPRSQVICFGQDKWLPPCSFTIDETSFWNRTLSPKEVRKLYRSPFPLPVRLAPLRVLFREAVVVSGRGFHSFSVALGLLNPFRSDSRVYDSDLPRVALVLSSKDIKYFNKYHNERIRQGLNDPTASSRKRRIDHVDRNAGREAVAELCDAPALPTGNSDYRRKVFSVFLPATNEHLFYQPVENTPFMLELTAAALALRSGYAYVPPQLCILQINNTCEGLYLATDRSVFQGLRWWSDADEAWSTCIQRLALSQEDAIEHFDRQAARYRAILLADRKSPWNSAELVHEIARQRQLLLQTVAGKPAAIPARQVGEAFHNALCESMMLGGNWSANLVTTNLVFGQASFAPGAAIRYRSLSPGCLSHDGVIFPHSTTTATARVEATVAAAGQSHARTFTFQILPLERKLPIIRIDAFGRIGATDDTDCQIGILPVDAAGAATVQGRVRLRGNTALVKSLKKYYRLKSDQPLEIGGLPARHCILLTSCYRDPTLMRDKLSYDLFNSFSETNAPRRAVRAQFVELVVQNDYKGVYIATERIDAESLGFAPADPRAPDPAALYKALGSRANFTQMAPTEYVQKIPSWKTSYHWQPYERLIRFIGESDTRLFREHVEQVMDVGNVIDFQILLLVTGNMEGANFNLYIAKAAGPAGRFFIVPWDYDMTFYTFPRRHLPNNDLFKRLQRDFPEYVPRLKQRWDTLRQDRLSEAELMRQIDNMSAMLDPSVDRNYARWPIKENKPHAMYVEELRTWIRARLIMIDAHINAL